MQWIENLGDLVIEMNSVGHMSRIWSKDPVLLKTAQQKFVGKTLGISIEPRMQYAVETIRKVIVTGEPETSSFYGSDILQSNVPVMVRYVRAFYDSSLALAILVYPKQQNGEIMNNAWVTAINAIGDGLWDCNYKENRVYVSAKWRELFGYEEKDIDNTLDAMDRLVHPEDLENFRNDIRKHIKEGREYFYNEHRKLCKNGEYKWILSRGYLLTKDENGQPERMVGADIDITILKEAQEMLRISRETFSNAFNYSGIGMALTLPDGKWLDVNQALLKILGYSRKELFNINYKALSHPEDADKESDCVVKMLKGEFDNGRVEKRYMDSEGKIVWAILNICLVRNEDATPNFFISQITDITYQKELIAELHEKTTRLRNTSEELHKKMIQLEDVNNMIVHNIRGPVGNIQALVDGYMEDKESFPLHDTLTYIKESSTSLKESLDTLVELSRIRLNKNIVCEDCDIERIVNKIKSQFFNVIVQKKAKLELQLEQKTIYYPSVYLESILYNFISNALKYSKPNTPPHLVIATYASGNKTILSVKDNGLGIDLDRFGDRIFKLNQTFHKGFDSKGLGLFLTKTQIETMGGTINVKSETNKGTEFIVTFNVS